MWLCISQFDAGAVESTKVEYEAMKSIEILPVKSGFGRLVSLQRNCILFMSHKIKDMSLLRVTFFPYDGINLFHRCQNMIVCCHSTTCSVISAIHLITVHNCHIYLKIYSGFILTVILFIWWTKNEFHNILVNRMLPLLILYAHLSKCAYIL